MKKLICSNLATESISFQETTFFKELVLQFTELKKVSANELNDSDVVANLNKIIEHNTGLNVAFNIDNMEPSVQIPMVNRNNVLINSIIRNHVNSADGIKMINDANGIARGTVSLKTGKVSGIFSDVRSIINLPINMFTGSKFTPEEITAITLHELGHLFTYYEFMSRTITTNQMLAGVSKALDGSDSIEHRESVFMNVKKAMNLKDLDAKALAKTKGNGIAEIVIISNISKEVKSELGSNIYDFSTWEYLADQYAARQGAGRHLVTGLEKVYKGHWNISFRSLPAYLAIEALKMTLLIAPLFTNVFVIGPLNFSGSAISTALFLLGMDSDNETYDRPGERMKRIRDQVVENLKDKKLSKDDIERLQEDLVAIDAVLSEVNDRRQFIGIIYDTVWSPARKARNQEQMQKELEDLAVNELFVKAAALKSIA